MKQNDGIMPYPIIKEDCKDFKKSSISVDLKEEIFPKYIALHGDVQLKNDEVIKDLKNNKLKCVLHVESPKTAFRKIYNIDYVNYNGRIDVKIPFNLVREEIELRVFVIVLEDEYIYKNLDFANFVSGRTFILNKGCILADWGSVLEFVGEGDSLKNLASIIKIGDSKSNNVDDVQVDLYNDNILIKLRTDLYKIYVNLGKTFYKNTILSLVLLPSLQEVLLQISQSDPDEFKQYHWFNAIKLIFNKYGMDINDIDENIFGAAQKLLGNCVSAAFTELQNVTESEYD